MEGSPGRVADYLLNNNALQGATSVTYDDEGNFPGGSKVSYPAAYTHRFTNVVRQAGNRLILG